MSKRVDTQVDGQKVVEWMNTHWKGRKQCPICGNNDWHIGDKVTEVRQFHGGDFVVGGPVYPGIMITCRVCGYTLFFNALVMGLVEPESKQSATDEIAESSAQGEED